MTHRHPARPTTLRIRTVRVAGLLVVIAAITAALGSRLPASPPITAPPPPPSTAAAPIDGGRGEHRRLARNHRGALGEADGAVPDATTIFDDDLPAVANLDADLRDALRQATTDAANDGIELLIDSGWRSPNYQQQLLDDAVLTYGSQQQAARWVATPKASAHVSGHAVDIGPINATAWLSKHGAAYGLCQTYANEPWHYQLRAHANDHGCPAKYADPTHDPTMQHR